MKHGIQPQNLSEIFFNLNDEDKKLEILLAFEAEFDIVRPFDVEWKENNLYFTYEDCIYFYKPQYREYDINNVESYFTKVINRPIKIVTETPHLFQFIGN